jgi:hypothetical protein
MRVDIGELPKKVRTISPSWWSRCKIWTSIEQKMAEAVLDVSLDAMV